MHLKNAMHVYFKESDDW